jgi:hypothetical protein
MKNALAIFLYQDPILSLSLQDQIGSEQSEHGLASNKFIQEGSFNFSAFSEVKLFFVRIFNFYA